MVKNAKTTKGGMVAVPEFSERPKVQVWEQKEIKIKMLSELMYSWIWDNAPRNQNGNPGVDIYNHMIFVMFKVFSEMGGNLEEFFSDSKELQKEVKRTKNMLKNSLGRI